MDDLLGVIFYDGTPVVIGGHISFEEAAAVIEDDTGTCIKSGNVLHKWVRLEFDWEVGEPGRSWFLYDERPKGGAIRPATEIKKQGDDVNGGV